MSLSGSSNSSGDYQPSGRLSNAVARLGRSRILRDFRTYYRFALFAVSITCFLNAIILILSILRFAIFDVIYFGFMAALSGVFAASIHYLMKYSNMPESTHWMTNAQTHITGSSIIAFFLFSFSSSLRAPFSGSLRVCLSMNTKDFLGNLRCQLVLAMSAISWAAPFSMLIAAWVIYFSAISITGAHPIPFARSSQPSTRIWRHLSVTEVSEPRGEVSLP